MKTKLLFSKQELNIDWTGDNFEKYFFDMDIEISKKVELKTKKLKRNMTDKEIIAEFKPQESTLGELAYAIKNDLLDKKNYNANIFYIRDSKNILWAVYAFWHSGGRGWRVFACSVEDPSEWSAGDQVVSRDCGSEPKNSDTESN